jgi:probable HAF family extracellular repeat protein
MLRGRLVVLVGLAGTIVFSVIGGNARGVQYAVTDLGTLGGTASCAFGINGSGQVVGWAYTTTGAQHAFLWSAGTIKDLGTVGGIQSVAYCINSSGEVGGYCSTSNGTVHAFLYSDGGPMQDFNNILGVAQSTARSINDSGQITGGAVPSGGVQHGFLYSGDTVHDLGTLGGTRNCGTGINNSGQVAGNSDNSDGNSRAFLYSGGTMQDLGVLGEIPGGCSYANGINDGGQVVGSSNYIGGGYQHAFRTAPGQPIKPDDDLGTLGGPFSSADAINSSGQVVGWAQTINKYPHTYDAFLYSDGGPMQDLNDLIDVASGWWLIEATAINDLGQIVGVGKIGGAGHGFLLTPVPEPSTLALLLAGAVGLLAYAWRRRR